MADTAFTQSLHATLEQSVAPDTAVIKAATVRLNKQFYTNAACVPALFEIASSSPNSAIRQLALVELRKRIISKKSKQYLTHPQQLRTALKARLLELVLGDITGQTRAAAIRVIAAIASVEIDKNTWPELLPWLWQGASDADKTRREVSSQSINVLLDHIAVAKTSSSPSGNYIPLLMELFSKTLVDSESLMVRVWTVRSLGRLAEYIERSEEAEIAAFQSLVPGIVGVLSQTLEAGDETAAKEGFEVVEGLMLAEAPLVTPHLAALVQFLLSASANRAYDDDLRIMALNALIWTIKFKKAKIQSLNLAGAIVTALLPVGAEPEPADADDDSAARVAFRVIDTLATSLPPTQVFPPLFESVRHFAASPDPLFRKSAITAFGVVVEGCSLFIQPHLEQLWPLIFAGLGDSDVIVRKASCNALGCLCEMLDEECAQQHAVLLPIIAKLMSDPETQRSACTALDCLLEVLGPDIEPYIPSLMESLINLLDTASLSLKGTVVGAIGSAAHASKAKFAPYFSAAMQRIVTFLSLTEEGEELQLRGVAQDTVGTLAESVGKELFRPYYAPLMQISIEAMAVPNAPTLKECSYIFWAVLSRVYGEEFQTYLPTVMPLLLGAIGQAEIDEQTLLGVGLGSNDFGTGADGDNDDGDDGFEDIDEDIGSDDEEALFSATTAIALEKEIAADSITELFSNIKTPFLPYVEKTVEALLPGLRHEWHEGIRKSSASALLGFIVTFHAMTGGPKWQKGTAGATLGANVSQLAKAVLPPIFEMWDDEEERDVVNELCNAVSAALLAVGPALIYPQYVERLAQHLDLILKRQAPCQISDEDDEEGVAAGEQSEYDAQLIGSASDLVGTLASVLGHDFAQLFNTFLPSMAQYYDLERATGDRSTTIGSLAEIVNGMDSSVTPWTETLFQLFVRALSDPEAEVQSNAAFALGSLLYQTQQDMSAQYLTVLGALQPLFAPTSDAAKMESARDNAMGAVARMILKNQAAVPLDQVLPIFLQNLPLKRDFAESEMTFNAIFALMQAQNPLVLQNIDHLLTVFQQALASCAEGYRPANDNAQLDEPTYKRTIEIVKAVNASNPEKIAAAGITSYIA
ncbi:BQ2448_1744 [Microbotryum intermedium]|uniref:BQ2448_1744 protein n=1 Tax=Microbotryum intermedium TaxID=269621 RepID=A0A238F931_9BASI|nr:BQ2448_1744 [Microbotryum intermedium]